MEYKPILFNTEMVRAILEGRKTQTRRIIKAKGWMVNDVPKWQKKDDPEYWFTVSNDRQATAISIPPPFTPDDILWVREAWCNLPVSPGGHTRLMRGRYYYKADVPDIRPEGWRGNWKPSIHMPKDAARIFLRVTDVRVECLQDSFNDIVSAVENFKAEGIDIGETCENCIECYGEPTCRAYVDEDGMMTGECHVLDGPRSDFSDLWDSTIKPADLCRHGWAANPWVWVIEFERIEGPPAGFFADRDTMQYADGGILMPAT